MKSFTSISGGRLQCVPEKVSNIIYACIVDDFSRFTWFILLVLKSDFSANFVVFCKTVERSISFKIKNVQCDVGGEFVGHQFQKFLSDLGIHQRFSNPYTP